MALKAEDVYAILNKKIASSSGPTQEQVTDALNQYMTANPIKLSNLEGDSEHRTVTDEEKKEWNNKVGPNGKLASPFSLTFTGAVTASYDGSGAVIVEIPSSSGTKIERIEKTAEDTVVELQPNVLYIFPEMTSLTYTLATPADTTVANEYHFIFQSGSTATQLVNPEGVKVPDNMSIESNKVYEISILDGCLAYQSWAVS